VSKGRRSGGFGDELGELGIYRAGSMHADSPTRPWVWTSGNRIITTPHPFSWNRISGCGVRLGVAHIVRKEQTAPGGWERGIATARRFFDVIHPWAEALSARPWRPYPKICERNMRVP